MYGPGFDHNCVRCSRVVHDITAEDIEDIVVLEGEFICIEDTENCIDRRTIT